eukprot:5630140-Pyramimonas_sp.AAC.1
MDEAALRAWCTQHHQRYEFWQQIKAFQAQMDDDAMSDAPSEATNDDARMELHTLKKRSIDNTLTPEELDKMEKLMQKQSQIKATKRLRTVREGATASCERVLQQLQAGGPLGPPAPWPASGSEGLPQCS